MPRLPLNFSKGIQHPAKIGTKLWKPTAKGFMSYAQNIDVQNDEFGEAVVLPGPKLANITNNSELTGVPMAATDSFYDSITDGFIYIAQGLLGSAKNTIRRIKGVTSSGTPQIELADADTPIVCGAGQNVVTDMVLFQETAGNSVKVLIAGWKTAAGDSTGEGNSGELTYASAASGSSTTPTSIESSGGYTNGFAPSIIVGDDGFPYWTGNGYTLRRIPKDLSAGSTAFTFKRNIVMSALGKFQSFMAIAYFQDSSPFEMFEKRKVGGKCGVALWNYVDTTLLEKDLFFPNNYCSAIVQDPNGNTLCFGGLDQGRTTLYELTGFGFTPLVSYIGDMPRNRHSVDFDAQGRILWQTCNGQILRYDRLRDQIDHLDSISCDAGAGGILKRLQGTPNDFLVAAGTGSTYTCKIMSFGSYIGDGDAADGITTPMAASGMFLLPPNSVFTDVDLQFQKQFVSGDKVEVRLYKNGDTSSYTTLGTLSGAGSASKILKKMVHGVNNGVVALVWKMTDAGALSPGFVSGSVGYHNTRK